MESLKKNKTLLIVLLISFVLFAVYELKGSIGGTTAVNTAPNANAAITTDMLSSLAEMQQATIDTTLFTSTAWVSLVDYSIQLPTDTPGRPELFGGTLQSTASKNVTLSTTTIKR